MLIFNLLCFDTLATGTPTFEVSEAEGQPGEEVTVTVSIVNNPGIAAIDLKVEYDTSRLEWIGVTQGAMAGNWDTAVGQTITWFGIGNYTEDGLAATLTFRVKSDASDGHAEVKVSYETGSVYNWDEEDVEFGVEAGGVEVAAHTHNWGEWTVTTPATCTSKGVETRVCASNENHTETREIAVDSNAHTWGEWTVTTPATSTSKGVETRVCANDSSHTETRDIAIVTDTPDQDAAQIKVESVKTSPGKEVSIPVIVKNNPGIASFQFEVEYDSNVLEWTGIEKSDLSGSWDVAVDESILWVDSDNYTEDGTLFTLIFQVKEEATAGTTNVTVTYDEDNVFDEDGNNVHFDVVGSVVTIVTHTPGDINGDDKVNNKDLLWLMKYIKGKEVTVVEEALDVNGDGKRNNKDLLWLMKYLKGKDVVIY